MSQYEILKGTLASLFTFGTLIIARRQCAASQAASAMTAGYNSRETRRLVRKGMVIITSGSILGAREKGRHPGNRGLLKVNLGGER